MLNSSPKYNRIQPLLNLDPSPITTPKSMNKNDDENYEDDYLQEGFEEDNYYNDDFTDTHTGLGQDEVQQEDDEDVKTMIAIASQEDNDDLDAMLAGVSPHHDNELDNMLADDDEEAKSEDNGPDPVEGMTLDTYLVEYNSKKDKKKKAHLDDELVSGKAVSLDDDGDSQQSQSVGPMDPTGLDGVSPASSQLRIGGYGSSPDSSPLRIKRSNSYMSPSKSKDFNLQALSPEANKALVTIMTQMANVQSQLNDLTQGGALAVKVLEQNKEQTGDTGRDVRFQSPLPTKKESNSKSSGGSANDTSLSAGAAALIQQYSHGNNKTKPKRTVGGKVPSTPPLQMSDFTDADAHHDNTDLVKEIRRKSVALKVYIDKLESSENKIFELNSYIQQLHVEVEHQKSRNIKAAKSKKKVEAQLEDAHKDLEGYHDLIKAVETLRGNETLLLSKIDELTEANKILSLQLKHSLARELEWRDMHKQDLILHQSKPVDNNLDYVGHANDTCSRDQLHSHRSMPDYDALTQLEKIKRDAQRAKQLERRTTDERDRKGSKKKASNGNYHGHLPKVNVNNNYNR